MLLSETTTWALLGPSESSWLSLAPPGSSWLLLTPWLLWLFLAPPGSSSFPSFPRFSCSLAPPRSSLFFLVFPDFPGSSWFFLIFPLLQKEPACSPGARKKRGAVSRCTGLLVERSSREAREEPKGKQEDREN